MTAEIYQAENVFKKAGLKSKTIRELKDLRSRLCMGLYEKDDYTRHDIDIIQEAIGELIAEKN